MPDLHGVTDTVTVLPPRARWGLPALDPGVRFCSRNAPGREALEAFIGAAFRRQHGATVRTFMPLLVGLHDSGGVLTGAAGYRHGSDGPLYLEQYLDEPVEAGIARRAGTGPVTRAGIAEIGNFACRSSPVAVTMVGVLAEILLDQGHEWVVFTATRRVRSIMRRMGLPLAELGPAERSRLAVVPDQWGSYYEHDPRVMLGYVPSWRGSAPQIRSS